MEKRKQWYFVTEIVLTYCDKKKSGNREKLLKFKAESRVFAKFLNEITKIWIL